nr:uncharacterized mitochondrial protein AtMg00810-like [Tanacetum cinerariifolium]GEZ58387.1 uncharacterized mitochondrial protein AtMg00810-like [Tanacetum cinerariifolium]
FVDPKFPNKVYKVAKDLYGLHQASRAWYDTLSTFLEKSGYKRGAIDNTLFIKQEKKDIMLVQVYVDDINFGSTKKSWCDKFEELMKNRFQLSSMGELTFFLGLQVKQKEDGIFISHDKYVAEILKNFDFLSKKTASTAIETQKPLVKDEEAADVDVHLYRSMIGSLMYLTTSRPDIMFAVYACSRFQVTPKTSHLQAMKRIFRYLKGQPKLGLWYPKVSSFDLEAYSDSDYAGVNLDMKSITGGCQFLGRRLISWQCKKQTIMATSTIECLSAKTTSWNEFSSTMASLIICLATNQKFNFSRYILLSLVKTIEAGVPFFMFPRFMQLLINHQLGDMSHHKDIYDNPSLKKKVFANMKRVGTGFSGVVTALFDNMLVPATNEVGLIQDDQPQAPKVFSPEPSPEHKLPSPSNDPLHDGKDSIKLKQLIDLCTHLSNKYLESESEVIDIKSSYKERIEKLEGRVDKLEEENRFLKEHHNVHSKFDIVAPVVKKEKSFKQGRIIADIDEDVEINLEKAQAKLYKIDLEHPEKVLSMQDVDDEEPANVKEVLEVVKAAKLMTEVVATTGPTTTVEATKVSVLRRRRDKGKGILIEEPKSLKGPAQIEQDEAFARQLKAELNAYINWNVAIEQVKRSERLNDAMIKYQALKRKPLTKAQARKNMIIYLKNMAGFKMNYFKEMTYSEIRPLFEKHFNYNQAFLEEVNEEVTLPKKEVEVEAYKREGESLEKEITKKQKMDEEAEELISHLKIMSNDDDDVYIEATPLASKIHIVDYNIHFKRNKPYFKIIRADGNHMLFLSFNTMLKNFDIEDLESL